MISWSTDDGTTWSETVPSITGAGELNVSVKAENPNYETVTAETTLKVTPKAAVITARNASKVYGTEDPQLEADIEGILEKD